MNKRRKIFEGKAKILFEGSEPGTLIQRFKDDATAYNSRFHEVIEGKGVLNNRICEFVFRQLGSMGVPTHFLKRLNMREQLVRQVEIIPVEVVVRNIAAGSLVTRLGVEEGLRLSRPLVEFYYKNDTLGDPLVSEEHIISFSWATPAELDEIASLALRINDFLSGLFVGVNITLVDFKIEFGRVWDAEVSQIILADEISPDCCRLWDSSTKKSLDKDLFRRRSEGLIEAYTEVARRLGILNEFESEPSHGTQILPHTDVR